MKYTGLIAFAMLASRAVWGADAYFPKDLVSEFEQTWYGKHLAAMKEPVLISRGNDKDHFAFRVLLLPTWGRPLAVRVEKTGDTIVRRCVLLSGDGGYEPGEVKEEKQSPLTEPEFDTLLAEIRKSGFWDLPAREEILGADGTQLVMEAIRDGRHVVFVRWTPGHDTVRRGLSGIVALYSQLFQEAALGKQK